MAAVDHPEQWPGLVERPARGPGEWPTDVLAVLVHGAMDRGAGMAQLARHLRFAGTLRYDRRGYGRAVGLGTGGLVRHIDDLVALVASRPAVLFGHSFGGLVCLGAAASGRLDVRGVVTWEVPTPWIPGWKGWSLPDPGDDPDPDGAVAEAFLRSAAGSAAVDGLGSATLAARRREGPALRADMDPRLRAGPPFDPARIRARGMFAVGGSSPDQYLAGARWLAERVRNGRVRVVPGAVHGTPRTRPAEVAAMLVEVSRHSTWRAGRDDGNGGTDAVAV